MSSKLCGFRACTVLSWVPRSSDISKGIAMFVSRLELIFCRECVVCWNTFATSRSHSLELGACSSWKVCTAKRCSVALHFRWFLLLLSKEYWWWAAVGHAKADRRWYLAPPIVRAGITTIAEMQSPNICDELGWNTTTVFGKWSSRAPPWKWDHVWKAACPFVKYYCRSWLVLRCSPCWQYLNPDFCCNASLLLECTVYIEHALWIQNSSSPSGYAAQGLMSSPASISQPSVSKALLNNKELRPPLQMLLGFSWVTWFKAQKGAGAILLIIGSLLQSLGSRQAFRQVFLSCSEIWCSASITARCCHKGFLR